MSLFFYEHVIFVWLWDTVFGDSDGKLQSLIPQINIVPEPRDPKVVASSLIHVLEANLEAGSCKFGDDFTNKKPKPNQKTKKNPKQTKKKSKPPQVSPPPKILKHTKKPTNSNPT